MVHRVRKQCSSTLISLSPYLYTCIAHVCVWTRVSHVHAHRVFGCFESPIPLTCSNLIMPSLNRLEAAVLN